ncbi:phage gp6-like head-tail connector protein [Streptomyces sp. NPDC059352]|uniref:phage gp6-like head-tail connector protein n=1 Tax=Streptomyces sp. NPDC059352 TaxID=3346810 RepID=UPI0036AB64F8
MVAPLYAALADLRAMLNLADDDTSRDNLLATALTAACRGIDRATGRRFYLDETATARLYRPAGRTVSGSYGEHLVVDDIGSAAGLTVETGTAGIWTPVTDYETGPDNALARGRPVTALLTTASWGSGPTRVRVTAQWGWPTVPEEIEQASLIQAARLYRRKDSPEGVTGSAEWGVVRLSRRDPDVWALIEHLIVPGFG